MNSDRQIATTELLMVANAMLEGREDYIEGVRKICSLRMRIDADNEAFLAFRTVDSETDHFPVGPVRARHSPVALAKADSEKAKYLADAKDDILAACQEIVRLYSLGRLR